MVPYKQFSLWTDIVSLSRHSNLLEIKHFEKFHFSVVSCDIEANKCSLFTVYSIDFPNREVCRDENSSKFSVSMACFDKCKVFSIKPNSSKQRIQFWNHRINADRSIVRWDSSDRMEWCIYLSNQLLLIWTIVCRWNFMLGLNPHIQSRKWSREFLSICRGVLQMWSKVLHNQWLIVIHSDVFPKNDQNNNTRFVLKVCLTREHGRAICG